MSSTGMYLKTYWSPAGGAAFGGIVEIFREWSLLRENRSLGEETGFLGHNPTSLHLFLPVLCLLITNTMQPAAWHSRWGGVSLHVTQPRRLYQPWSKANCPSLNCARQFCPNSICLANKEVGLCRSHSPLSSDPLHWPQGQRRLSSESRKHNPAI